MLAPGVAQVSSTEMLLENVPPASLNAGASITGTFGVKVPVVANEPHLEKSVNGPAVAPIGTNTLTEVADLLRIVAFLLPLNFTESVLERFVPEMVTSVNPTFPDEGEKPETVGLGNIVAVTTVLWLEQPDVPSMQAT